jgi:predicted phage baseplate assembly protein
VKQLAPDLFERRFSDLMEIGRARLPALAPDWTDHNAHDPGITLMELLAWVAEAQLYALARRPRRDERAAYAALLGFAAGGTQPARGLIWADHGDPRSPAATFAQSVVIADDAVIHVLGDDTPSFRPERTLLWVPGAISRLESRLAGGRTVDLTAVNERGGSPFLPFGENAGSRDVLAMTFHSRGDSGIFGSRRQDAKRALWPIGVRATTEAVAGTAPPRCRSPLEATLVVDGERVPLKIVSDTTFGLLATGVLLLDLDAVASSPRDVTLELRAPNGFPRPPRLLRIEPNVIPIVQGRSIPRELHVANGLPDWSFSLNVPGLRFAPGEAPVTIEIAEVTGVKEWRRSERLSDTGPDDRVFELDAGRALVTFGNGVNGKIPPAESQVLVSYAVCDADKGNVARNRRWSVAGFEGTFGVNIDRVAGGAAPAGAIDQRRDARVRAGEEHALVSSADLAAAAKALPLLEVARAWVLPPGANAPRTGVVTLVVMRARPDGKEPAQIPESRRWLDAVRRQLVPRVPLGTRLLLAAPRYVDFWIQATLLVAAGRDPEAIKKDVERELAKRLALLDRRPGVAVTPRDVAAWLRGVDGERSIAELHLQRRRGKDEKEIAVPRGGLPRFDLSRSTIEVQRS